MSVWLLTVNWWVMFACNIVLPDSRFEIAIRSTFAICRGAWLFGLGALALTERDCSATSKLQLCGFHKAPRAVLSGLVLLSFCRHTTTSLMRSRIITWLGRLVRHTTSTFSCTTKHSYLAFLGKDKILMHNQIQLFRLHTILSPSSTFPLIWKHRTPHTNQSLV